MKSGTINVIRFLLDSYKYNCVSDFMKYFDVIASLRIVKTISPIKNYVSNFFSRTRSCHGQEFVE